MKTFVVDERPGRWPNAPRSRMEGETGRSDLRRERSDGTPMTATDAHGDGEPGRCSVDPARAEPQRPAATPIGTAPRTAGVTLARRTLLRTSTAAMALGATGLSPREARADPRGQPFDDGTYFDDGYGWRD